ncbi:MAG: hypothetical protein DVB31_06630 [Verrucomicrobia bacterium]|nr:MAG: hypothetical protein DVB31_06630 [Verrucomicrobiota bacterium]
MKPASVSALSLALGLLLGIASPSRAEDLAIVDFRMDPLGARVRIQAKASSYYLLVRGEQISDIQAATDARLGSDGQIELVDRLEAPAGTARFYRVVQLPLTAPRDVDRDGLDDVYELSRPPFLDPFNPDDAGEDPDHDGLTTLQEYRGNTDPLVSDLPPAPAVPRLAAIPDATSGLLLELGGTAPANTYVRVEGGAALATNRVATDGSFALTVPLNQNRLNRLFVAAVDAAGNTSVGQPLEVLQDSQPPTLFVDFPAATNGLVLDVDRTLVSGRVGDALSGYRGLQVWVHSSPSEGSIPTANAKFPADGPLAAGVDVGIGPNGTFHRTDVPLAAGPNTLTVIASDLLGNRTFRQVEVVRQTAVGPRLLLVSGDLQRTNVQHRLATPLKVRALKADGTPLAGTVVAFEVTRSDGRLLPLDLDQLAADWNAHPNARPHGAMRVLLRTDAAGEARVSWTLGSDSGSANNRVAVGGLGMGNRVYFCASAVPSPARQINIGSGHNQTVETGASITEPLRAWVSDGLNPTPGTVVTFRVVQGGGKLTPGGRDGTSGAAPGTRADELAVTTGITGHASVGFLAGPDAGPNLVEATFPGQLGRPATFLVRGVARMAGQPGVFTGLVLDNASQPIGHAYCELEVAQYKVGTFSDVQGRFRFNHVPGGMGHLRVNGTTATSVGNRTLPTNSFPALSYGIVTVANAENSLPTPVLLPRLDPANATLYDGTHDLAVTCSGIAGLRMVIRSNSMHHADGVRVTPERPALVSLNQVHHDKIPMPMPDGVSPPFAWTLQPGGSTFDSDKAVRIEYPNMSGLPAGSVAYFLSFNHDTERFEIVSSGHVSEDGAQIVTDPNAGLTLAGWGCNCPPYSVAGDCHKCEPPVPTSNGCGAAAMGGGNKFTNCGLIPPPFPGIGLPVPFCFTVPCDHHDICYGTCHAAKNHCDVQFLVEMMAVCDQAAANNPVGHFICEERAFALYQMVSIFGGPLAYDPAQKAACVCQTGGNFAAFAAARRSARPADGPVAPYLDLDGDLLPDEWERAVGLDPTDPSDTFADPDGDGLNNFVEFFLQLDPLSPDTDGNGTGDFEAAALISPGLARPGRLDPTWRVQIGSQTVNADVLGNFRIGNISVADVFGANPGDPPDFVGDDLLRVIAVSDDGGKNRYATSGFFRLLQSQVVAAPPLVFSDVPPLLPESIQLVADDNILSALGAKTRLHAVARFGDGSTGELNSPAVGTTFRVSNPGVVSVDADGNVTAIRAGRAILTASNQGATGTAVIDVAPGATTTANVAGMVRNPDGTPAAGVIVTLTGLAVPPAETGVDGRFEFAGVPTAFGPFDVIARRTDAQGRTFAAVSGLEPGAGGTADAGTLTMAAVARAPRFLSGGALHAVATRNDGSLWAWGGNDDGQVGTGDQTPHPTPTRIGNETQWTAVSSGPRHNLALRSDGSLWAWGDGSAGQLGLGNKADQAVPTRVGTATDWSSIATGDDFSLALRADGSLWGWGVNFFGQVGGGGSIYQLQPTEILPGSAWRSVAAGRNHGIAVRNDGTLWGWGDGHFGQLGEGTLGDHPDPRRIGSGADWESVAAAADSSFGIRSDGSLWSWGINSGGQLGLGDFALRTQPTRSGADSDWWSASCSSFHTVVLKLDGSVWGFGGNDAGELADDQPARLPVPRRIVGGGGWKAAIAGTFGGYTLLVDRDGRMFGRGNNAAGQLGIGRTGQDPREPSRIDGGPWLAAGAGNLRSAGIRQLPGATPTVAVWGNAPLGDGTFETHIFPVPVALAATPAVIAVGSHFQTVGTDGTLWGWGENFRGQVGTGSAGGWEFAPVRIGTRTDWLRVDVSSGHSLGITVDGALWAWGDNASGQIGAGPADGSPAPVRVDALGTGVVQASAGDGFSLAVRGDGSLWSWGGNSESQLGNNGGPDNPTPARVGTDNDWRAVSAGTTHALAVKNDGSLWGWGRNRENQLGDGTTETHGVPTLNPRLADVTAVDAGYEHSLAIRADGSLWAWGRNNHGQLGDGTTENRAQPVRIGSDTDWVAVAAGAYHSMARKSDGSLWAWGDNELGATGTSRYHRVGTESGWGPALP